MADSVDTADFTCPECGARDTLVSDTRPVTRQRRPLEMVRRRRRCKGCGFRRSTYELAIPEHLAKRLARINTSVLEEALEIGEAVARVRSRRVRT